MRAVLVLVFVACGAPPSQVDAGAANRPPRIVETTPALRSSFNQAALCPSLNGSFELIVEDLDHDVLYGLWFINPAPNSLSWPTSPVALTTDRGHVQSPSALSFKMALANLPTGVHLVTAWVADAPFTEPINGEVTAVAPGVTDSYTWVLDVVPCP